MGLKLITVVTIAALWLFAVIDLSVKVSKKGYPTRKRISIILVLLILGPLGYFVFSND
jgi:hypothetical protein